MSAQWIMNVCLLKHWSSYKKVSLCSEPWVVPHRVSVSHLARWMAATPYSFPLYTSITPFLSRDRQIEKDILSSAFSFLKSRGMGFSHFYNLKPGLLNKHNRLRLDWMSLKRKVLKSRAQMKNEKNINLWFHISNRAGQNTIFGASKLRE